MEKKKFLDGTELGSKREPATNASSESADDAAGVVLLGEDTLLLASGGVSGLGALRAIDLQLSESRFS